MSLWHYLQKRTWCDLTFFFVCLRLYTLLRRSITWTFRSNAINSTPQDPHTSLEFLTPPLHSMDARFIGVFFYTKLAFFQGDKKILWDCNNRLLNNLHCDNITDLYLACRANRQGLQVANEICSITCLFSRPVVPAKWTKSETQKGNHWNILLFAL